MDTISKDERVWQFVLFRLAWVNLSPIVCQTPLSSQKHEFVSECSSLDCVEQRHLDHTVIIIVWWLFHKQSVPYNKQQMWTSPISRVLASGMLVGWCASILFVFPTFKLWATAKVWPTAPTSKTDFSGGRWDSKTCSWTRNHKYCPGGHLLCQNDPDMVRFQKMDS